MVGAQTAAPVATVPAVSNGTNASDSLVRLVPALLSPNRRGIVYDRWPFRLDIDTEYQDWILVATCVLVFGIWCTPCICGRLSNPCSRCFTSWVYTRLHVFFCIVSYLNLIILMLVIGILPDWTVNESNVCDVPHPLRRLGADSLAEDDHIILHLVRILHALKVP